MQRGFNALGSAVNGAARYQQDAAQIMYVNSRLLW
jgi:hypothetical protein